MLPEAAPYVSWMGLLFKLSLQMIVMPIVLSSILCGLESIGDIRNLKGLGRRAVFYYLSTTMVAITVGLLLVTTIRPGEREPSAEISQLIENAQGQDNAQVASAIYPMLSGIKTLNLTEKDSQLIRRDIEHIALHTENVPEFKEQTLKYLASFEFRSKLGNSSTSAIGPVETPSFQRFFEDQLRNALKNPFEALAKQQVLAVIVFTLLFGAAMTTIGPVGAKFFEVNRAVNMAIIKIIQLIMKAAPLGVFGLLVSVISATGPEVFKELFMYALCVILGLSFHLLVFLPGINFLFTRQRPWDFINKLKPALSVAFATSSSNATLPVTMQTMEENFGVDQRVSRFILPLGATVNMDGTALYEAVAAVFIAQLYGVTLGLSSQIIIAVTAACAAIGTAGIPAAGTVTMALILSAVGLPLEGVGLLFALDRPLDMCRTAVNVAGDATGCTILNNFFKDQKEGYEGVGDPVGQELSS